MSSLKHTDKQVKPRSDPTSAGGDESIVVQLERQRQKSRTFLSDQKTRLDSLESELLGDLSDIEDRRKEWEAFETQVTQSHNSLTERDEQLQRQRARTADRLRRRRSRLNDHRDRVADELQAEIERLQSRLVAMDVEASQQTEQIAMADEERLLRERLQAELATARDALVETRSQEKDLRQQLGRSRQLLTTRAQQVNELREQLEANLKKQAEGEAADSINVEQLVQLSKERDALSERITELESQAASAPQVNTDASELAALQRRFELVVEKVRDLKTRNIELERELAQISSSPHNQHSPANGETGSDATSRGTTQDHAGQSEPTETTPSATDEHTEQAAAPPAEQREALEKLQDEWREKLRAAEVEISIERAENARIRTQMQEKMHHLEAQLNELNDRSPVQTDGKGKTRRRRRWMDRLGLSDDE